MSDVWAPPRAEVKDVGLSGNPDAPNIREKHINHEASLRALGLLYYLGATGTVLASVMMLIAGATSAHSAEDVGIAVGALLFGTLYLWIARGLRTLNRKVRIPAGVLAGIGLIGFPVGTLFNAYVLHLLFSEKGKVVFSDEYKQIIADTPDIKSRTSIIVWLFAGLLLLAILVGLVTATMRGH